MKKFIVFITVLILCMASLPAYAGWIYEDGEVKLSPDSYTEDGKIKVFCAFDQIEPKPILTMELPNVERAIPKLTFYGADWKTVSGKVTYPNINDIKPGIFDLQWVFTPDDDRYATINGVITFEVWPEDDEIKKGKIIIEDEDPDEPTNPSLTATKVQLLSNTFYDINLNNKIPGSKYKWTSSNPAVAKVNEKNGFVTAVSEGTAIITCEITLPNGTTQILQSLVTVGYDENAPVLTDTQLDLEIGDKYDINVENKIAKSKYRWVSSDRNVVKVNSSNGKVTAVGPGVAYITCTITSPDRQVIVLRCDISVTEPTE